jgi:hypothetical protein
MKQSSGAAVWACRHSARRSTLGRSLLDPDPAVRRAVAGALAGVASTLSPTEVRRLIAVRTGGPWISGSTTAWRSRHDAGKRLIG